MSTGTTIPEPPQPSRWFPLADGRRIAADEWGDPAAQPVVFLHGGGQTRHAWAGSAQAIAEAGWRTLALDHRGHGQSDWLKRGVYDTEGFVDDFREVVAQIGRPPVAVGASLGGITAMLAESRGPGSILAGLVLVDVTPRLETEGLARIIGFMGARPDGFTTLEEAADAIGDYMPNRPRPKDLSGLAKNLRKSPDGRFRWHWDPALMGVWGPRRFDPEVGRRIHAHRLERARSLRIPTLLVRGRMSDVVSEQGAREFLDAVPHAEYVDLEAAGHMVAGDRNDAFAGSVLAFLQRHFPPRP